MLAKKIAVLAVTAAISAPALADGYRGHGHGHGHYKHGHYKHARTVVVQRPVVVHHYYRPAPRPVYVVHRPAPVYAPVAPVYHYSRPEPVVPALLVGAVLGAAIVHHAVTSGY